MLSFEASEAYLSAMGRFSQLTPKSDQRAFENFLTYMLDRMTDQKVWVKT